MEAGHNHVVARKGEEFEIDLTSTPSTGYIWDLAARPTEIEVVPVKCTPPAVNTRNVGGTGAQVFRFQATAAGQYTITFMLKRPWEKCSIDWCVFRVDVSD
jgi:predicted secreted protein